MKARGTTVARLFGLLMLVGALGACATTGGTAEGRTAVIVENNLTPPTALTIYAVPDTGSRMRVGTVEAGETTTLRFNPLSGGQYQFVAQTTAGREIVSNPISVTRGDSLSWDLQANIVVPAGSG